MPAITWRIVAPHFVAGIVSCGDVFRTSAPIIRWVLTTHRSVTWFAAYCRTKGWTMNVVGIEKP